MNDARGSDLAGDMLEGAEEIAEFLWGDRKKKRRVYALAETGGFPIFRFGQIIHARKSALMELIKQQEKAAIDLGRGA